MVDNADISRAMKIQLKEIFKELPPAPEIAEGIRRAQMLEKFMD